MEHIEGPYAVSSYVIWCHTASLLVLYLKDNIRLRLIPKLLHSFCPKIPREATMTILVLLTCKGSPPQWVPYLLYCQTSKECYQTVFFQVGSSHDTATSMDTYAFQ